MKANAPEKLYISDSELNDAERCIIWFKSQQNDNDIEYTRTDAFIKKASKYFHRCLEDTKVIDDYRNILVPGVQASYTSVEEFIDDFKNYMKGE